MDEDSELGQEIEADVGPTRAIGWTIAERHHGLDHLLHRLDLVDL